MLGERPHRTARGVARCATVLALALLMLPAAALVLGGSPLARAAAPTGPLAPTMPGTPQGVSAVPPSGAPLPPAATIPVGTGPDAVAVDAANATVFVANEFTNNVTLVSLTTNLPGLSVPVGNQPAPGALAVDPVNGTAYVANEGSNNVTAIALGLSGVSANIPVGTSPDAIVYDAANGYVYVANGGAGTVSVISTVTNAVVATVPVGGDPDGITIDTQNHQVFVADAGTNNVSVISGTTNVVVATITVGTAPGAGGSIAYDSVHHNVFVACVGSNNVSVIGGTNHTLFATVNVGSGPAGIAIDPTRGEVYVANRFSANVSVLSSTNGTLLSTIAVGSQPSSAGGVAFDPSRHYVYIPNEGSNNVSVISTVTNSVAASIPVLESPIAVALNAASGAVYVADEGSANVSAFGLASVTFTERGLTTGAAWSVAVGTVPVVRANTTFKGGGSVSFLTLAGPFPFTIAAPVGFGVYTVTGPGTPSQSLFNVIRAATPLKVLFRPLENLTFAESGLPTGATWGIALTAAPLHGGAAGQSLSTIGTSITFVVVQGAWKFQVTPKPSAYGAAPAHGGVGVGAHATTRAIKFHLLTNLVTFHEAGLKSGTRWQVNLTGPVNVSKTSTGASIVVHLANGTYNYTVANVGGSHPTPTNGSLTIVTPGRATIVLVTFTSPPVLGGLAGSPAAPVALRSRP